MANEKLSKLEQKQAEKRKKAKHYKILLGVFALHSYSEIGEFSQSSAEKLRKFINDDKKFNELKLFIEEEINNKK